MLACVQLSWAPSCNTGDLEIDTGLCKHPPDVPCPWPLPAACSVAGPQPGSAAPRSWLLTEQLNACSSSLSWEPGAILETRSAPFQGGTASTTDEATVWLRAFTLKVGATGQQRQRPQ